MTDPDYPPQGDESWHWPIMPRAVRSVGSMELERPIVALMPMALIRSRRDAWFGIDQPPRHDTWYGVLTIEGLSTGDNRWCDQCCQPVTHAVRCRTETGVIDLPGPFDFPTPERRIALPCGHTGGYHYAHNALGWL